MDKVKMNSDKIIEGIHLITGIHEEVIRDYADSNNIFDIIDHPAAIGATDEQCKKIILLKDFINAYQYLRNNEAEDRIALTSPEKVGKYFISQMAHYRERECVLCLYLDSKMHIISCEKISQGTINSSAIYPREVLKRALQLDCAGIVLSHNHPSGDSTPSGEDIVITRKFLNIFNPLGMRVYDHIIVADDKYLSMAEKGMMKNEFNRDLKADYEVIQMQEYEDEMSL